jgi:hypothetical protein
MNPQAYHAQPMMKNAINPAIPIAKITTDHLQPEPCTQLVHDSFGAAYRFCEPLIMASSRRRSALHGPG